MNTDEREKQLRDAMATPANKRTSSQDAILDAYRLGAGKYLIENGAINKNNQHLVGINSTKDRDLYLKGAPKYAEYVNPTNLKNNTKEELEAQYKKDWKKYVEIKDKINAYADLAQHGITKILDAKLSKDSNGNTYINDEKVSSKTFDYAYNLRNTLNKGLEAMTQSAGGLSANYSFLRNEYNDLMMSGNWFNQSNSINDALNRYTKEYKEDPNMMGLNVINYYDKLNPNEKKFDAKLIDTFNESVMKLGDPTQASVDYKEMFRYADGEQVKDLKDAINNKRVVGQYLNIENGDIKTIYKDEDGNEKTVIGRLDIREEDKKRFLNNRFKELYGLMDVGDIMSSDGGVAFTNRMYRDIDALENGDKKSVDIMSMRGNIIRVEKTDNPSYYKYTINPGTKEEYSDAIDKSDLNNQVDGLLRIITEKEKQIQ